MEKRKGGSKPPPKAAPAKGVPKKGQPTQQPDKGDKKPGGKKKGDKPAEDDGKKRMRTSKEVYDRINWDKSKNIATFTVGYEDRFFGMKEIPFLDFTYASRPQVTVFELGFVHPMQRVT